MDIGFALSGVHRFHYNHRAERDQPAQNHLRDVYRDLPDRVPPGMKVLVSGAGQSLATVPWIAVLDTDVTSTATEGLYVVYLYRTDLTRVYLSMNQGATQHRRNAEVRGLTGVAAQRDALTELRHESTLIRNNLDDAVLEGLLPTIDLAASHFLPRGYEEGNIAAIEYDPAELPEEAVLRADLARFLALYADCVEIKRQLLVAAPGVVKTAVEATRTKSVFTPRPPAFRPKNSSEYRADVPAQTQVKTRRHESLLELFADHVGLAGLTVANNVHPCDLTVESAAAHWLVEAKTVGANAEDAVRAAIGQLFSYRHFYYRDLGRPDPALVALFSEPVGDALVELLTSLGIEAVWRDSGVWRGQAPTGSPALHSVVS